MTNLKMIIAGLVLIFMQNTALVFAGDNTTAIQCTTLKNKKACTAGDTCYWDQTMGFARKSSCIKFEQVKCMDLDDAEKCGENLLCNPKTSGKGFYCYTNCSKLHSKTQCDTIDNCEWTGKKCISTEN